MVFLKFNEQRAKNAIAFIWVVMAIDIINALSCIYQYTLVRSGTELSQAQLTVNQLRISLIMFAAAAAQIISIITFIQWFRRAYYNLHQKVYGLSYSEGWAAGAWFVPFLNLVRPYEIMKELYVRTKSLLGEKGVDTSALLSTQLLGWWWALWLINAIMDQVSNRLNQDVTDGLVPHNEVMLVSSMLGIPLALIAVRVIKDYARVEPLLPDLSDDDMLTDNGSASINEPPLPEDHA
jgi:hypothetical protein